MGLENSPEASEFEVKANLQTLPSIFHVMKGYKIGSTKLRKWYLFFTYIKEYKNTTVQGFTGSIDTEKNAFL